MILKIMQPLQKALKGFILYNQQDAPVISNYLFLRNALHVLEGLSVHQQQLKTVYTATVYVKQLLLSGMRWSSMEFHLIPNSSR
jgi:hypothetical protein